MRRMPLPEQLAECFTVAEAREAGVSTGRLQRGLVAPFHGTRAVEELADEQRLQLLLNALPDHAFACGPTAAGVHGLPLPQRLEASAFLTPKIGVPHPATRIRRPGVIGRTLRVEPQDIVFVRGMRCTSPARTWVDLGASLPLGRLVAAADFILARRRPLASRDELCDAHIRAGRSRGAANRVAALELCTDASESPRESELRVLLFRAGLPMPTANVEIFDGFRFVARVDLLFASARLIVEYDGDYHRDPDQWSRDQSRRAELESLGYRVTVVTARDFDDPGALVRRIGRLLNA